MQTPDNVRKIPDPVRRITAAQDCQTETQRLAGEYASITSDAVRQMRQTMSLAQVAAALGITRSRVQQIEKRR